MTIKYAISESETVENASTLFRCDTSWSGTVVATKKGWIKTGVEYTFDAKPKFISEADAMIILMRLA